MQWKKGKQLKYLADAPVIRVVTVSKECRPQVTPVCHVVWRGKIYWCSDFDTAKLKNLEHHRWAALVADEYKANWRNMGGVEVRGKAKIIRGGPLFRQIRDQLYKKYPVYKSNAPFEEGEAAIIEVTPERLFNWWFK
jgi:nitroimidazol reductase NimA-like FMN-containing flavoprotein (pyridoxamine 5'-phosphate oxidase superfamily)